LLARSKITQQNNNGDGGYMRKVSLRTIFIRNIFPSLKQDLGGQKVEDDFEVQTAVTGRLIRQGMYLYEYGAVMSSHGMIKASYLTVNVWMSDGMAVRVNVNCS
jgi:hypothetical protein